jgi:HK97 family phage portal protein
MIVELVTAVRHLWTKVRTRFVKFKDTAGSVEIFKKYGNQEWAQRHPKTRHDIDAPKVNANVYIATRAISDAIKSLPVHVVEVESIGGIEREINNDHPANEMLRNPNTEHSWSDVIDHVTKSYLNDGNAVLTIEKKTGPNTNVEIWPRDPRNLDINTRDRSYRFGVYTTAQKTFPRNRVIHIRDMDVDDPFWGVGRINTVREEIMMDYFINRFNSNFFRYGATINLMFTPDHDLTEDQHLQILDAMSSEVGGADQAFKIFINRYAGKFETPEQKHKDIAFKELLEMNREKIFGVYGLPPFRGGVMRFANYANAIAQDKDFWLNTIQPILKVIEDAFNKQLLWPIYGPEVRLKFDLDSVASIKGTRTEIEDRLLKLKQKGIVSAGYVREQLNIDENAKPDEAIIDPDAIPVNDTDEEQPTKEEQNEVDNALARATRFQRTRLLANLSKLTASGSLMSVLCDPVTQVPRLYDGVSANRIVGNALKPILRKIVMERGAKALSFTPDMSDMRVVRLLREIDFKIESVIEQNTAMLQVAFSDADQYHWTYWQLERRIRGILSQTRTQGIAHQILRAFIADTVSTLSDMKHLRQDDRTSVIFTK